MYVFMVSLDHGHIQVSLLYSRLCLSCIFSIINNPARVENEEFEIG